MPRISPASATTVLDLVRRRPQPPGRGAVLAVDGPAGSGKTTLAAAVADLVPGASVVHTDDMLAGWTGLPGLSEALLGLLEPLAAGGPGRYRRFDWDADRFAEEVVVDPSPLLVVEGVGSGALPGLVTVLAWVEAPYDLRIRRGIARDGDAFAPHWETWADAEMAHFAEHRTRERADVVIDGTGRGPARMAPRVTD